MDYEMSEKLAVHWFIENGYRLVGQGKFDETIAFYVKEMGLASHEQEVAMLLRVVLPSIGGYVPADDYVRAAFRRFVILATNETDDKPLPQIVQKICASRIASKAHRG